MLEQLVRARLDHDGHQVVVGVIDRGYHPDAQREGRRRGIGPQVVWTR